MANLPLKSTNTKLQIRAK